MKRKLRIIKIKIRKSNIETGNNSKNFWRFRFLSFGFVSSSGFRTLSLIVILTSLYFILNTVANAQSPAPSNYDVTVSPVFFDLSANPGDTLSDKVRIRNNTTSPLPIKLAVERLAGDVNGDLTLKQDANDNTLSWITFQKDTIVANPLEWTEVPFTITIPKDAAYGYYWAITFKQDNTNPLAKTGAAITGAAAVPILLDVRKPGAKADAKILKFTTDNFINEYLPINFKIQVQNIGNIHVKPVGNIFITNGLSKNIATLEVNTAGGNIIPETNRIFNTSWDDGFIVNEPVIEDGQIKLDKNGKPVNRLVINWNKLTSFRIGKYTASLLLVFDNGKKDVPLEATLTFWVIPWKVLIVLFVSLTVLIILIRIILKWYINREIRKRLKTS